MSTANSKTTAPTPRIDTPSTVGSRRSIPSARGVLRLVGAIYVAVMLFAGAAEAQPVPSAVDSIGRALVDDHPGGAVIGLLHDDETSVHPFGAVDTTGTKPTARTIFEIGSVTKTFTGLLLAGRIERDRLRPETPVAALLPDSVTVTRADSVGDAPMTLAHLATHRSGLPRLPSNLKAVMDSRQGPYATYGDSALYAFLDAHTLARTPGTHYQYSNLGMGLLGHLLARRADTTYAALVRRRIAGPLDLSDTRIDLSDAQAERFAQGHNRLGFPAPPWHFEALAGAGAIRSTAADLLAYLRAHRAALRASPDTASGLARALRHALTPQAETGRENTRVGFGWHETVRDGHRIAWHNGGTGGFKSFVGLNRATGRGVVVLVSAALPSETVDEAALRLLNHLRPD
jgi:CubicO group peptidase (beta-lactamase class C family)